ncbi:MAG: hypothetical protein OFPI_28050 [Osedax symbiont Rs2]|nr:MAG: hypothetical protein OFPI_28050 [Osedax symbiont Rs2]
MCIYSSSHSLQQACASFNPLTKLPEHFNNLQICEKWSLATHRG